MFWPLNSMGFTFITMCLALSTNFNVFMVSSMLVIEGEMFPTMKVKVLLVRES